MTKYKITVLLLLIVFISSVYSDPIIIRTGSGLIRDQATKQDANIYDLNHHKGISNYEADELFNEDNKRKFVKAEDVGKYGEILANKKQHQDEGAAAEENFHQQGGGNLEDFGNKQSHNKGHHKSGFHNSYHKDETGSNSSYYDDGEDHGDEYVYNTKKGSYGDIGEQRRKSNKLDYNNYAQDQAKKGQYENGGKFEQGYGNNRNSNQKKYYEGNEDLNRRNHGSRIGEGGRYSQEKYVEKPQYQYYDSARPQYYEDGHYQQYGGSPHKTITIYEDPRVYESGAEYEKYQNHRPINNINNNYDNDYVQLDVVKRPVLRDDYRYYDRRPNYDYYY